MAIQWYYSNTLPSGGASQSRSIYVNGINALITKPQYYGDVLFGTKDNPAYRVSMSSPLIGSTTYYYYIDANTNIGNGEYTGVVGVIEGTPSLSNYTLSDKGNKPISGKWRTKPIWSRIDHGRAYLLPINNTITLKDGTSYASIYAGSKARHNTYPYLSLGGKDIGVDTGVDFEVSGTQYEDMMVDFGDIPQDAPALFTDYIENCFYRIYPNTYTINTPTGEPLASITEQPEIIATNLVYAGDSYSLSLRMSNDTVQTLTWSYPLPEGKIFSGLGIKQGSYDIVIPVGERSVEIKNSTNFYLIFDNYTPPPVFPDPPPLPEKPPKPVRPLTEYFDIALYQCTAEYNRVDKTNYLTQVGTLNGVIRDASSITDLTITIESLELPIFNYVYITNFNRYYFVNDIRIVRNFVYEIDMTVDVLMSYKNAIKSLRAFVDRNENTQNPMLIDKKRVIEQGVDITEIVVSNSVPTTPLNEDSDIRYVINGYKIGVSYVDE